MNADKRSSSMLLAVVAFATMTAGDARAEGRAAGGQTNSKITRWTGSLPAGATTASASVAPHAAPMAAAPVAAKASVSTSKGGDMSAAASVDAASKMAANAPADPMAAQPAVKPAAAKARKADTGIDPKWVSQQNDASEALRQEQMSRIAAKGEAKGP